jgi:hypothetical protein
VNDQRAAALRFADPRAILAEIGQIAVGQLPAFLDFLQGVKAATSPGS